MDEHLEKRVSEQKTLEIEEVGLDVPLSQNKLRDDLLSGAISPEVFRDSLVQLDQEGSHVENAAANIALLEDPELRDFLFKNPDHVAPYHRLLSLSYFHEGQRTGDIDNFIKSYEAATSACPAGCEPDDWSVYAMGTWAFFAGQEGLLAEQVNQIADGRNKEILENLLNDLRRGGEVTHERYLGVYQR